MQETDSIVKRAPEVSEDEKLDQRGELVTTETKTLHKINSELLKDNRSYLKPAAKTHISCSFFLLVPITHIEI